MQLVDLRNEVFNKGFDPVLFGATRVNQYLNDGYLLICQRVQFYADESAQDFATVAGTTKYPWPANFARLRHLWDTTRDIRIIPVSLREIDNSGVPGTGPPQYYANDGSNVHLWPTPDAVYNLEMRYWVLPSPLVNDTDVPVIPAHWHNLLWRYATAECYKSEDDANMGQFWTQDFERNLSMFSAEVKFPDTDTPDVAKSFWDQERGLTQKGWSLWGWL